MEPVGTNGLDFECPDYIDRYADQDYFPGVEVKDGTVLRSPFGACVHRAVAAMEVKCRTGIPYAWCYLNEVFNVFVEHDASYVYSEKETILAWLGLVGKLFE